MGKLIGIIAGESWKPVSDKMSRSRDLNPYEKAVLGVLRSYGKWCYPSIETIMADSRCCRERVYKSLKSLEEKGQFTRYKLINPIDKKPSRSIYYLLTGVTNTQLLENAQVIRFSDLKEYRETIKKSYPQNTSSAKTTVRPTNSDSSSGELTTVRLANPIDIHEKNKNEKEESFDFQKTQKAKQEASRIISQTMRSIPNPMAKINPYQAYTSNKTRSWTQSMTDAECEKKRLNLQKMALEMHANEQKEKMSRMQ